MKNVKNILASLVLLTVVGVSSTFAGVYIGDRQVSNDQPCTKVEGGIMISGLAGADGGIMISGFAEGGIMISGLFSGGIMISGDSLTDQGTACN